MAVEVGTGGNDPSRRKAAAKSKKKATSSSKGSSKARRSGRLKSRSKARRPRESDESSSVRRSRNLRSLERDSESAPSNPDSSRNLVSRQGSVARDLVGPRLSRVEDSDPPEEEGSIFDRIVYRAGEVVESVTDNLAEAQERREQEEAELQQEAASAYTAYSEDPSALADQLSDGSLEDFSEAERLAIAQLSQENDSVGEATRDAVRADIDEIDSFEDIPTDRSSQILLNAYGGEEGNEHLGELLEEHLNNGLNDHIERLGENGLDGDDQADGAIEALLGDAEDLVDSHPALAAQLEDRFNAVLESSAEDITDVRRNDDNAFQRFGHTVSGGARSLAGGLGDGLRFAVSGVGDVLDIPQQLAADVTSFSTEVGGDLLGRGLDSVGLDGAADFTREASEAASERIQQGSEALSNFSDDVYTGIGEGVALTVEGVGEVIANPVGTAQGIATLANSVNVMTLPADIIRNGGDVVQTLDERRQVIQGLGEGIVSAYRETNEEHGAVAATSHAVFDIVTTIGTGGVVASGRAVTTVAGRLGRITRAANVAEDLGDVGRVTRFADEARVAAGAGDNLAGVADEVLEVGDDLGRHVDDARPLPDLDEAGPLADLDEVVRGDWTPETDLAALDPFDPRVRSQVRSPGWPQDPEYLDNLNATVRQLADDPPATLQEALDSLSDSPLGEYRRARNPQEPFFEFRETRARTGVEGRYGDTTGPFGNFGERARAIRDGQSPLATDSVRIDGIGDTTSTVHRIGDEVLPTNGFRGEFLWHTEPEVASRLVDEASDLYRRALDPATSLDDTVDAVARLNWNLAQATPFGRGSAAGAEAITRSILDARGISSSAYRRGVAPDLEAFVSSADEFAARFPDFFERPPSLGLDEAARSDLLGRTAIRVDDANDAALVRDLLKLDEPSVAFLDEAGLGPRLQAQAGGRSIALSQPFRSGDRTAFIAYLEDASGAVRPRTFYQSQSQGGWRSASSVGASWGGNGVSPWIGKGGRGLSEFATDLPIDLQADLHRLAGRNPAVELSDDAARQAFYGHLPAGDASQVTDFTRAVESPRPLGSGDLLEEGFVRPDSFRFDNPAQGPRIEGAPNREFAFEHPLHGQTQARSFLSGDGSLEYLFLTDESGRSWIGQVDNLNSPVNEFGVRSRPVDPGNLTQPAVEYGSQIPSGFTGAHVGGSYLDGSAYTNLLPPVQNFQQWLRSFAS